jgi:hypothetical protein
MLGMQRELDETGSSSLSVAIFGIIGVESLGSLVMLVRPSWQ